MLAELRHQEPQAYVAEYHRWGRGSREAAWRTGTVFACKTMIDMLAWSYHASDD